MTNDIKVRIFDIQTYTFPGPIIESIVQYLS